MAHYLQKLNHEVVIFSPKKGELYQRAKNLNIEVINIDWKKTNYFNPVFLIILFIKFLRVKPDKIVFNSFIDVRDAALIARIAGIKKRVLRVGMPILPPMKFSYLLSFRLGLNCFVGISQEIFNLFTNSRFITSHQTEMIPNGIDLDLFRFKDNFSSNKRNSIVFGNCVRLTEQKGLGHLLNIVKGLKDKSIPIDFQLAGKGELQPWLEKQISGQGLTKEIQLIGHVEKPEAFYHKIDILVFTSLYEGTARTIIEAMASGCIVICFDTSSMAEMIDNEIDGYKIKAFSVDGFINQIIKIMKNDKLDAIATKARDKVEVKYNKKNNFKRWKELLTN